MNFKTLQGLFLKQPVDINSQNIVEKPMVLEAWLLYNKQPYFDPLRHAKSVILSPDALFDNELTSPSSQVVKNH